MDTTLGRDQRITRLYLLLHNKIRRESHGSMTSCGTWRGTTTGGGVCGGRACLDGVFPVIPARVSQTGHNGKVLCLFFLFVVIRDSNEAELMAIEKASQLCASNSFMVGRDITIVSDSKVAILWINEEGFKNLSLVNMVYDVRSYLATLGGTVVSFVPRASNSFADSLAKLGSSMSGDFIQWGDS
ncbi:hypothetical protein Dsin_015392 [Dipteronia sinensis]|uniref:RNase H type-1 domain-containing protein n=1 Tax=Dipteronia sinensis TaxID=43782 RepID=A0AAE0AB53_9ROSI|nr:hypothetical protein Dsin_015392 [Dipteronia sinensis]